MPPAAELRWVVTGAGGMLGRDLVRALDGRRVLALERGELDIRDATAVRDALEGADIVVNAAAFTRVDDAESNEGEALAVNGAGAANLASTAAAVDARLVQVSTDYVFDGTARTPYAEDAPVQPIGAYGRTKAAGELAVRDALPDRSWIVRTAWLYGDGGPSFVATMLRLAAQHPTVSVITDQVGQPTWSIDVARQIIRLVDADAPAGIYHATNSGSASRFEFATAIFEAAGLDPARVLPTTTAAFTSAAARPAYSVLGHAGWARAGLPEMRDWREALASAARDGILDARG